MNWPATIANSIWLGTNLPAAARFKQALAEPGLMQNRLLMALLADNANSAYGREYDFNSIQSYSDFVERVPVVGYSELEPWIARIQTGECGVLTQAPVTHLVPTSGSSGAQKRIPFTQRLQTEFSRAIAPWMMNLFCQHPKILIGPAYWSISPPPSQRDASPSAVPVGFADDSEYLGGNMSRLVRSALVFPRRLLPGCDMDTFRFETLLSLLQADELRLISIWHPSFLTLLLDALPDQWGKLLPAIAKLNPRREQILRKCDPHHPASIWPKLSIVSCWGDGTARLAMNDLRARLPEVCLQAKGLLATEACVSIPIGEYHPIAICSHFFEFIDSRGNILRAHELQKNATYEVLVSTGGGLWRYRLGDMVRVTGFLSKTPSLQFLERSGHVSDLFGEKLSELFVTDILQNLFQKRALSSGFALLAPNKSGNTHHYTLYVDSEFSAEAEQDLETMLARNPHYETCRRLGQLAAVTIHQIRPGGYDRYCSYLRQRGMTLGDIKPASLSKLDVWSSVFD